MTVQELESAIVRLTPADLSWFAQWFEEYLANAWDRKIESDVAAGRLDEAGRRADAEFEAGRCRRIIMS